MKATWLGHAAFVLQTDAATVLIDPFISGNSRGADLPDDVRPGAILVTHGHHDHLGDALELSRRFEAPIVAVPELANHCAEQGAASERMNYGGTISVGGVRVTCVPAFHTSSIGPERVFAGNPCGFVVELDGQRVYHAGDTCAFGDMELIARTASLDLALLPIGGRFTMDPAGALVALSLLRPRAVIPMHYNTFPLIDQDADAFARAVREQTQTEPVILEPGGSYQLDAGTGRG